MESTVDVIYGVASPRYALEARLSERDPMAAELGAWEAAQRSRGVEVEFVD